MIFSNKDNNAKRYKAHSYCLLTGIINNYIAIINGKNFYDHPTDSGMKGHEEVRKLTAGQCEDYFKTMIVSNVITDK